MNREMILQSMIERSRSIDIPFALIFSSVAAIVDLRMEDKKYQELMAAYGYFTYLISIPSLLEEERLSRVFDQKVNADEIADLFLNLGLSLPLQFNHFHALNKVGAEIKSAKARYGLMPVIEIIRKHCPEEIEVLRQYRQDNPNERVFVAIN